MACYGTYREEDIDNIHDNQDKVSDTGVVIAVAGADESRGNDVMAQHLPVVLSSLLNLDNEHLLQPEAPLSKNVKLHEPVNLAVGPVGPKLSHVQVVG